MLSLDWKSYFAARADNELGNRSTAVYTKAWSPDNSKQKCLLTLILGAFNVLLANDYDKKIHALHSFKVAGGTLLCPTTKLMWCLLRTGANATALLVDKPSFLNLCNLVTPTIDGLQECSKANEVNKIEAPNQSGAVTYPCSASFFTAPWLVDMIMNAGTNEPSKLIPTVNTAAIEFDTEHENDKEYTTTAANHSGDFILWAWGVKAGKEMATRLMIDPNDTNLEHFKIDRHQSCNTQPLNNIPDGLPPPPARDQMNTAVDRY
jgi:hypothetical protein